MRKKHSLYNFLYNFIVDFLGAWATQEPLDSSEEERGLGVGAIIFFEL